ncbi:MAG: PEGA domain-containing protein, partial [Myxococcota bacterium]
PAGPEAVEEWRTRPDAPDSKPHPDRVGKLLERPVETYDADQRAMARRGAWVIGEPAIGPGSGAVSRRRQLLKTVLPGTVRRRAAMAFLATTVACYFVAARHGPTIARVLGPSASFFFSGAAAAQATAGSKAVAITVRTSPPGATVTLDGNEIGVSPVTVEKELPPGEHKVTAAKGKSSKDTTITLAEDQAAAVALLQLESDGEVDVRTSVPGARVYLDGMLVGEAPQKLTVPRDRARHLVVRTDDAVLTDQRLKPDRPGKLAIEVGQDPGGNASVVVQSDPPAWLALGDKDLGRTTGSTPLKLPAGRHRLVLKVPALGIERELNVEAGGRQKKYFMDLHN